VTDWQTPYAALLHIADAPTFDDLVERWEGFRGAARRFRRETYSYRRSPMGRKWHGAPTLRANVRGDDLQRALFELRRRIAYNPAFDDRRAESLKAEFIDLIVGIEDWQEKPS
jgi:hypothetical protein